MTGQTALGELDTVRIVRLLIPNRPFDGSHAVKRPPELGDEGTIVYVHHRGSVPTSYTVEAVDTNGNTLWLADFVPEELLLMTRAAERGTGE